MRTGIKLIEKLNEASKEDKSINMSLNTAHGEEEDNKNQHRHDIL